jgi:hypothetical protein
MRRRAIIMGAEMCAKIRARGWMGFCFSSPQTHRLATFIRDVGIGLEAANLSNATLLPGLEIRGGVVRVDEARLLYPGDLLHEAGHVAVADPATRNSAEFSSTDGEEIAAIAWSYAASCALGLAPDMVFHPNGYKGGAAALVENFTSGRYIGVPLLQWWGMTVEPHRAAAHGVAPYPHMLRWLR